MGTDSQGPARPLNAVVHRFDGHNDRIPHEVIALEAAGAIRVRLHVAFEDMVSFPDAETIVPWNFYACPFDFDAPSAPPELIEALEPELHRFLIHHARVRLDETHESFFLQAESIYSDVNLFYRLAAYFHAKLVEYAVEVILFDEVPHYGFGYLLYLTARAMGIRTIMFLQNVHLERSLVFEDAPMNVEIPRRGDAPHGNVWTFKDETGRNIITNGTNVMMFKTLLTVYV